MTKQESTGTDSRKLTPAERIWHTVGLIPEGNVASYGKIADLAGLPGRARYVGYCLRNVPASLKLPWHRVLRSNGQIAFQA
ncbi:MAG TPA: cysteine methyltransferase, partial [Alteromonas sp.]|nr:cysteine methyltransferase [Alteromonas sp.]